MVVGLLWFSFCLFVVLFGSVCGGFLVCLIGLLGFFVCVSFFLNPIMKLLKQSSARYLSNPIIKMEAFCLLVE